MTRQNCRLLRLVMVFLTLRFAAHAQQANGGVDGASADANNSTGVMTLHEGTHLVVLDVVVTDKKGHTIRGLSQDDFHIFEDGQAQTVKFFEEHAPVDPELVAKQKAELAARLPPNTFTAYEPFTGDPVTILLLNKLTSLPDYDIEPLRQRMLSVIDGAPAEAPFVVYQLDTKLRLVQPVTTNRSLLFAAVSQMWYQPEFGVPAEGLGVDPSQKSQKTLNAEAVLARRKVFTAAMQQLRTSFGPAMGRKTLFAFTGGIRCTLSSEVGCEGGVAPGLKAYFCGELEQMEQARISLYRNYPDGEVAYGLGCGDATTSLRDIYDTNAHYYTFYYTPANQDWNGNYRQFKVAIADKNLRLSYRAGYFAREENAEARHGAAGTQAGQSDLFALDTATGLPTSAEEAAGSASGAAETAPEDTLNPTPITFTVKVEPAAAPGAGAQATPPSPGNDESERDRLQGYRDYTLHFFVPVAGLRLVRVLRGGQAPGQGPYSVGLEITAVSYVRGHPADNKTVRVSADFGGPDDPHVAKGAITASLTVQMPEKGPRLLHLTVRDVYTGQSGRLDIPAEKIVLPAK